MDSHLIEVTTLGDLLLRAANKWPDHEALVFPSERLTYAQLAERAKEQACALQGMGIAPGDHVGILAPNQEWPISATKIQKFKLQEMLARELGFAKEPS
jgi:acyl-CoA synthetase (AMP-forming)/AMP-acid ligase II